ncbi:arylsulfatase [Microbacterium sp. NRRL B-14842]|uniref:arylsulfatase n=1 Tax=Microbacterium sp. NRRL B-14842 TaxID=3162881 RepID=UPI003D286EA4
MSEFNADFSGEITLDVRDSRPDWSPYELRKAPDGAPNVLVVLYDDTGLASWSPYGGRIAMPTMDRLAAGGLTYTQWHTTALCSPTRSTMLTGRNHHVNRAGVIMEGTNGFPGFAGRLPADVRDDRAGAAGERLQHVLARQRPQRPGGGHRAGRQPLDVAAATRVRPVLRLPRWRDEQLVPDLVEDNHFIEQPYRPEDGYHLSKDLADQALAMIRNQQASNPSKPWYMWFCPGANHAPHHAPQEYIDKYKGAFDDGYDAYREWVLARMIEKGVLPEGTQMTPFNPLPDEAANPADYVRPWAELNDDERRLFARMAEVFAGFSEYTDAQVGRIVDYLEETGQLDNTIIFYCADNGASGEGSPDGSVNENKFFNGYPDDLAENLAMIDTLGSADTYNHYPTGWAAAFSTPFQMFKRYSQYSGGTCDPMVVHWPKGIAAKGELRHQYHHSVDVVATVLDVIGIEMPESYRGVPQRPLDGVSMKSSFDAAPDGPTQKTVQYYSMLGTRGIWKDGWKAAAVHAPLSGKGHFDDDVWELYHVAEDRSESNDLAATHPEKLQELITAWFAEAEANFALPLDDRSAARS